MPDISANELKTKGISALEVALKHDSEAVISVRGRPRFVVMDIAQYERLREAEIFSAWKEARLAESSGEYLVESAEEHIARLERETPRMAFKLIFPVSYQKREQAFLAKHPELKARYYKTLLLSEQNPQHPSLRLHALKGKLAGLHSISISKRYRITLELELRDQEIVFINIGSHGEVY